jgi:hypothetical protein
MRELQTSHAVDENAWVCMSGLFAKLATYSGVRRPGACGRIRLSSHAQLHISALQLSIILLTAKVNSKEFPNE